MAPPGVVTRIVVRWAPTDLPAATAPANAAYAFDPGDPPGYVWHCHIIDHEDNEMMRPTSVRPNSVVRSYVKGTDY
jgi:FtsP/CotA-like multicopper oxidase with cupredoxin domain